MSGPSIVEDDTELCCPNCNEEFQGRDLIFVSTEDDEDEDEDEDEDKDEDDDNTANSLAGYSST